jgi:hypothetical protein
MANRVVVVAGIVGALVLPTCVLAFDHVHEAGISATVGTGFYLADEDSRSGGSPRPEFGAVAEYATSAAWSVRMSYAWGWTAYPEGRTPLEAGIRVPKPVKILAPITFGWVRRFSPESESNLFLGAGVGLYWWQYRISGKIQRDPQTLARIESSKVFGTFDPGVYGQFGYERPLTGRLSIRGEVLAHYVFAANEDDFPGPTEDDPNFDRLAIYDGNDVFVNARLGVTFFFDLTRFEAPEASF